MTSVNTILVPDRLPSTDHPTIHSEPLSYLLHGVPFLSIYIYFLFCLSYGWNICYTDSILFSFLDLNDIRHSSPGSTLCSSFISLVRRERSWLLSLRRGSSTASKQCLYIRQPRKRTWTRHPGMILHRHTIISVKPTSRVSGEYLSARSIQLSIMTILSISWHNPRTGWYCGTLDWTHPSSIIIRLYRQRIPSQR